MTYEKYQVILGENIAFIELYDKIFYHHAIRTVRTRGEKVTSVDKSSRESYHSGFIKRKKKLIAVRQSNH